MMKFTVLALSVTAQTPQITETSASTQFPTTGDVNNLSTGETSTLPESIRNQIDASEETSTLPESIPNQIDASEGLVSEASQVTTSSPEVLPAASQVTTSSPEVLPAVQDAASNAASNAGSVANNVGSAVANIAGQQIEGFAENGLNKFDEKKDKLLDNAKGVTDNSINKFLEKAKAIGGGGNPLVDNLVSHVGNQAKDWSGKFFSWGKENFDRAQDAVQDELKEKYGDAKDYAEGQAQTAPAPAAPAAAPAPAAPAAAEEQGSSFLGNVEDKFKSLKFW